MNRCRDGAGVYRKKVTIRRWFTILMLIVFIALFAAMLGISAYAGSSMRRQATLFNEDSLTMYTDRLDTSIEDLERFLSQYATGTYDVSVLALSKDEQARYVAKSNILQQLKNTAFMYDIFSGLFVYSHNSVQDEFLCQLGSNTTGVQAEDVKSMVEETKGTYQTRGWELRTRNGKNYLVRAVNIGSTSSGAWIDMNHLMLQLENMNFSEMNFAVFTDRQGVPLTGTDKVGRLNRLTEQDNGKLITLNGIKYLQISKEFKNLPIMLSVLIPDEVFAKSIRFMQMVIFLIFAAVLCMVPLVWYTLSKSITRPVKDLINAMKTVESGNLDVSISEESRFKEFNQIFGHFNSMVVNIRQLKDDVYERQIREQKTQLQYLQLQIKPHFFLNTLNVIYSFALVKRCDLISDLTVCLSKYFRYMFRSNESFVTLRAEQEHINNYMRIQELRYPGSFIYRQEIEEVLLDAKLPPLVIQTFIENSIKYALVSNACSEISLIVETFKDNCVQGMRILISDNGSGYPQKVLDALYRGVPLSENSENHIGISNVVQRLRLIYGDRAKVVVHNAPQGGAVSEILLPLEFEEISQIRDEEENHE